MALHASSNENSVGIFYMSYEVEGHAKNLELEIYDGVNAYRVRFHGKTKNVRMKTDRDDTTWVHLSFTQTSCKRPTRVSFCHFCVHIVFCIFLPFCFIPLSFVLTLQVSG